MTSIHDRTRRGIQGVTGANPWALQPHLNTYLVSARVIGNKAAKAIPSAQALPFTYSFSGWKKPRIVIIRIYRALQLTP